MPNFQSSAAPFRLADHSADRRMVMLAVMALVVGSGGAAGAWLLLGMISFCTNLFWFGRLGFGDAPITDAHLGLWSVLVPVAGALLIGLMAKYGSEKIRGHGIPEAIETILYGESRLSPKVAVLKPLSSAISIGSGGPFGAEGPIIMTGGAVGSLFAQCFHLSAAERKTLLVAGASAGMTAVFGTPLAAILLAVELLLFEWKPRSLVPVIVASLVSLAWRSAWHDASPMFATMLVAPPGLWPLAAGAVLGLAQGTLAAGLSTALYRIEDAFHHLPVHWMWWPAVGAIAVGAGGYLDPRVLGAGYANIGMLLSGHPAVASVLLLVTVKAAVWLISLGSGTSGGVLAPLLMIGGATGWLFGHVVPGEEQFWALIGMAGIMSCAMRAPLTGIVFAAEITGRYDALPVMVACSGAAFALNVLLTRRSILTEKIARRGQHLSQEFAVDPLDVLQAGAVMTKNPDTLPGSMSVAEAVTFFSTLARHRSYPVVGPGGHLLGVVSRSDALAWRQNSALSAATLADTLSDSSHPVVHPDTPCSLVADTIVQTGFGRIPVIARSTGIVVGLISRQDLLTARLAHRRQETDRHRSVPKIRRDRSDAPRGGRTRLP